MLAFCIVATGIHFADNVLRFDGYSNPEGLTPGEAILFWLAQTALGLVGGFVPWTLGRWLLVVYGGLGLLGLGHYALPGAVELDLFMHATIILEGVAGLSLIAWVLADFRSKHPTGRASSDNP